MNNPKYDIALSFAGEDRSYVSQVAEELKRNKLSVFYDNFETVNLWGKDMSTHFDKVYRKESRYVVPFISKHYKNKIWTKHEFLTALAKAMESADEYILPARFDDTEIEGIRPTIGFIDLRQYTPQQFAALIIQKVKGNKYSVKSRKPETRTQKIPITSIYLAVNVISYDQMNFQGVALTVRITSIEHEPKYFYEPSFQLSKPIKGNADSFHLADRVQSMAFPVKLEYGQVLDLTYPLRSSTEDFIWKAAKPNTTLKAVTMTTLKDLYDSNSVSVADILEAFSITKRK